MLSLVALAALQSALPPSASSEAKPKWSLEYAPNVCILSRARAGVDGGISIEARPYEMDHAFKLLLPKVGKGAFFKPGTLSVPEVPTRYPRFFILEETAKGQDRLLSGSISEAQMKALTKDATLGVTVPGKLDESVSVAGLAKALVALDRCKEDLARRWGTPRQWAIDPEPLTGANEIIRNEDYPQSLVSADVQGSARLMLQIDSSGQIQNCRALDTEGPVTFAQIVYDAYKKRMRFRPAKDSTGAPVPSYFVLPEVRFILAG